MADTPYDFSDSPEDPQAILNEDFSLEDEYKPEPLVPQGNYTGNVVAVTVEPARNAVAWKVCLEGNGGNQSDGETPIDGKHLWFRNWLPKSGDDKEMTSTGTMTKRQSKINMLKRFAEGMKVSMDSPQVIIDGIESGDWIGMPVIAAVAIDEYQGITRNQISKMVATE